MEDMIRKIVEIDKKAYQKKIESERIIKEYDQQLEEIYKDLEDEILTTAKTKALEKKEKDIKQCEEQVSNIELESQRELNYIDEKIEGIYDSLKNNLFNTIISS